MNFIFPMDGIHKVPFYQQTWAKFDRGILVGFRYGNGLTTKWEEPDQMTKKRLLSCMTLGQDEWIPRLRAHAHIAALDGKLNNLTSQKRDTFLGKKGSLACDNLLQIHTEAWAEEGDNLDAILDDLKVESDKFEASDEVEEDGDDDEEEKEPVLLKERSEAGWSHVIVAGLAAAFGTAILNKRKAKNQPHSQEINIQEMIQMTE